jgi:alkanesulfonate monooxygenase SsuD/methylene tetrahydromethanopterin reductase-like flavin-dependent oxidoreductase (luciferase family)
VLSTADRLRTNTAVYRLPLRHPVLVARQLADVAGLAPGRLVFGVGIGGEDAHELEICGVDPRTRGRRMDESLTLVRELLTGKAVDAEGKFFAFRQAQIVPAPAEPVPIVVGGRSDAAIDRAGRFGDGWFSRTTASRDGAPRARPSTSRRS